MKKTVTLLTLLLSTIFADVSRKDELILEGLINDTIHFKKLSDYLYKNINAYGSVVSKSIVISVYPTSRLSNKKKKDLSNNMSWIFDSHILQYEGFEWARKYKIDVIFNK
jgi:hypothetical protein